MSDGSETNPAAPFGSAPPASGSPSSGPACGRASTRTTPVSDFDRQLALLEESLTTTLDQARLLSVALDAEARPEDVSDDAWGAWRARFSALCDRGICDLVDIDVEAQFDSEA